jgi:uncharacterized membrane protein HdeD (DUF308 family)
MKIAFVNGILAIIFGSLALILPEITIVVLSIYFAISLIAGGIALIIFDRKHKQTDNNWRVFQIEGIIGILIGVLILIRPVQAATFFTVIIGLWAIFMGIILLFTHMKLRIEKIPRLTYLIGGVLSLVFGALILLNPFESLRVLIVLIGLYAILYGVISIFHTSKMYMK